MIYLTALSFLAPLPYCSVYIHILFLAHSVNVLDVMVWLIPSKRIWSDNFWCCFHFSCASWPCSWVCQCCVDIFSWLTFPSQNAHIVAIAIATGHFVLVVYMNMICVKFTWYLMHHKGTLSKSQQNTKISGLEYGAKDCRFICTAWAGRNYAQYELRK